MSSDVSDDPPLPPSGRWRGITLCQVHGTKGNVTLHLDFQPRRVHGTCADRRVTPLQGTYDAERAAWRMVLRYTEDRSDVDDWTGFAEGRGIWGTWTCSLGHRGGFRIWPIGSGTGPSFTQAEEVPEPVEAHAAETV